MAGCEMGMPGRLYERAVSTLGIQETGATVMKSGDLHEEDFFFFFFFAGVFPVRQTLRVCAVVK